MFYFFVFCVINLGFLEVMKFVSMENFLFVVVILFLDNLDLFFVYYIFCFMGKYN